MTEMPEPWIDLKEACRLKGIRYNSVCRRIHLWKQPKGGVEDAIINGRKHWRPETVAPWVLMDDETLARTYRDGIVNDAIDAVISESRKE